MIPEVNSKQFEISNRLEMLFRLHGNLHGDFTAAHHSCYGWKQHFLAKKHYTI